MVKKVFRLEAPLRIDFCGGFTDVDRLGSLTGSSIVNLAIDLFEDTEHTKKVDFFIENRADPIAVKHPEYQFLLDKLNVFYGFQLDFTNQFRIKIDVPISTGLGTSGALCILLIAGVKLYKNSHANLTKNKLWKGAKQFENRYLNIKGGHQDYISALYGGYNFINAAKETLHEVKINHCKPGQSFERYFRENCIIVYSKRAHTSSDILEEILHNFETDKKKYGEILMSIKEINDEFHNVFSIKELNNPSIENLSSCIKKSSNIRECLSTSGKNPQLDYIRKDIDELVHCSHYAGGGGGTIVLYGKPHFRQKILSKLKEYSEIMNIKYYFPKVNYHGLKVIKS